MSDADRANDSTVLSFAIETDAVDCCMSANGIVDSDELVVVVNGVRNRDVAMAPPSAADQYGFV